MAHVEIETQGAIKRPMRRNPTRPLHDGTDSKPVVRDYQMPEALSRYEFLPTNHLIWFDDRYDSEERLTQLNHNFHFVECVRAKRNEQAIYTAAKAGTEFLRDRKQLLPDAYRWMKNTKVGRGILREHNLFACVYMAQIEIAAKKHGVRFINHFDILRNSPLAKDKEWPLSIPCGESVIRPDAVFGLQYPDGEYKFFAYEYDRGSESAEVWRTKFENYKRLGRDLDGYLGIPKWHILGVIPHVPKYRDRPSAIMGIAKETGAHNFCMWPLDENPTFDRIAPINDRLFTGEWLTPGGTWRMQIGKETGTA